MRNCYANATPPVFHSAVFQHRLERGAIVRFSEAKISDGAFTTNSLLSEGQMTAFQPMLERTAIRTPCGASRRR
jgi:hypothetical protein